LHNDSTNSGQISDTAATNTSIAGAAAALAALLTNMYQVMSQSGRLSFDLPKTMHGALTGLVSVSAGAGVLEPWAACVCGIVAAWVYLMADVLIVKIRIDDPVHGISVHGFGGIWGLLCVGLLASPQRMLDAYGHDNHVGWFYSIGRGSFDASLLGAQITAMIFIMAWTAAMIFPFFIGLSMGDVLRIDELEEIAGLDAAYQSGKQEDDEKLKADIREEFKKYNKESKERSHNHKSSRSSDYEDPVNALSKRSGKSSNVSVGSNDKSFKSQNTASSADDVDV
jgi:ammonium transporter, Amt family